MPLMTLLLLGCCVALAVAADAGPELLPPRRTLGDLGVPGTYRAANDLAVDISEYAGYAGLIVANGGLQPAPDSFLARQYGLRLQLRLSESENWRQLNEGRFAATVTTADTLALLGSRMRVVVPVLLSYSRGADAVVARHDIATINQLRGQRVVLPQFTEAEFFLRYLAAEADVPVRVSPDPAAAADPGAINLVFAADGFAAGDRFLAELDGGRLAACVTWAPKTEEVVQAAGGRARVVVSNRNLLIIADVLLVNAGFAREQPQAVRGLVHGILEGNRRLREEPERWLPLVAAAFGWEPAEARRELAKVHLANRAENLAFFSGTMDAAGSFSYILQSANAVYSDYGADPLDPAQLLDLGHLQALAASYPGERVQIAPLAIGDRPLEPSTVLTRDIRFYFRPNSAELAEDSPDNLANLERLAGWLRASPGSVLLLIGHVEPSRREELRAQWGRAEADARARRLGEERASAVRDAVLRRCPVGERVMAQSRGWEEPIPGESDLAKNRRVEVRWQVLE
ncbi:MAG: hypothetical protein RMM29_09435 [Planctomycetota bacterium]|nr:hypothetical protein [Planctomycetota bacterium]MCX8040057.1 hypothetical protein [Planctomycetota bacterium]MDW8373851.1 hypothetical protein [Planctomycetota bacterium]